MQPFGDSLNQCSLFLSYCLFSSQKSFYFASHQIKERTLLRLLTFSHFLTVAILFCEPLKYYNLKRMNFIFQTQLRANPPPFAPATATAEAPETRAKVKDPDDCGPFQIPDAGISEEDLTDTTGRRCDEDAGTGNPVPPHYRPDEDSSTNLPYSEDTNQQGRSCEVVEAANI